MSEDLTLDQALDLLKNNIQNYSSIQLCELVVTDRYLKLNQNIQVLALTELDRRRSQGENFDFETYIKQSADDMPVNGNNLNIQNIMATIK